MLFQQGKQEKLQRVTILRHSARSYFRNTAILTNIKHTLQVGSCYPTARMEERHAHGRGKLLEL